MVGRENPISVRSKRLITDALIELMGEKAFSKISIRDIVERAGLTRQTFYHNFDSKEEVLLHKSDSLFGDSQVVYKTTKSIENGSSVYIEEETV